MSACIRFSGNAVGGYIPASNLAAIVSAAVLQGINPVKGIKSLFGSQARETLASALLEAAPSEKTILDSLIGKL